MSEMWDRSEQRYWILCGKQWLVMRISDDLPVCTFPRFCQDTEMQRAVCFAKTDTDAWLAAEQAFETVKEWMKAPEHLICMIGPGGKVLDVGTFEVLEGR